MVAKSKSWARTSIAALDRNGICLSQTPAAGGVQSLTIAGVLASAGVATLDIPRHVGVYSGSNIAARVFTVTGTDAWGRTVSETITGVNAGTVAGVLNFVTVTAVTVDDDTGAAVEVGTVDSFETPWYPLDRYTDDPTVLVGADVDSSVNFTWGLQITYDAIREASQEDAVAAHAHKTVTGKTGDYHEAITDPASALRFAVTSYVAGGATFYLRATP